MIKNGFYCGERCDVKFCLLPLSWWYNNKVIWSNEKNHIVVLLWVSGDIKSAISALVSGHNVLFEIYFKPNSRVSVLVPTVSMNICCSSFTQSITQTKCVTPQAKCKNILFGWWKRTPADNQTDSGFSLQYSLYIYA